jgi:hypothetical protein
MSLKQLRQARLVHGKLACRQSLTQDVIGIERRYVKAPCCGSCG